MIPRNQVRTHVVGMMAGLVVVAGVAAVSLGEDPPDANAEVEAFVRAINGDWIVFVADFGGHVSSFPKGYELMKVSIRGRELTRWNVSIAGGSIESGTFTIVGGGPGGYEVDVSVLRKEGSDLGNYPDVNRVSPELWRLTPDRKLQVSAPRAIKGGERPTGFSSTRKGDPFFVLTYGRARLQFLHRSEHLYRGSLTLRDPESGMTFYVESNGTHVVAIDREGKLAWGVDMERVPRGASPKSKAQPLARLERVEGNQLVVSWGTRGARVLVDLATGEARAEEPDRHEPAKGRSPDSRKKGSGEG